VASKTAHLTPYTDFLWSREDYQDLVSRGVFTPEDKVELLDGHLITMAPQQSAHATATRKIRAFLSRAFSESRFVVDSQLPLALDERSEPEPDLMVVRGQVSDFSEHHPTAREAVLVVEVSDSSLAYDRGPKLAAYARAGIPEYWIINLVDRVAEIHRQPDGELYADSLTLTPAGQIAPAEAKIATTVAELLP